MKGNGATAKQLPVPYSYDAHESTPARSCPLLSVQNLNFGLPYLHIVSQQLETKGWFLV